jgi:hypothetical protein
VQPCSEQKGRLRASLAQTASVSLISKSQPVCLSVGYYPSNQFAIWDVEAAVIVVIMLNLLIALMADTFERVTESWVFESRKMRVETIIEKELLMNDSDNTDCFPAFLQVLRPVEDVVDEWAGVSGQVSAVRDEVGAVKRESRQMMQKVDTLAAEMKEMKAEMRANQEEMKAEMRANQETMMEQLRNMAMQKADPHLY